MIEVDLMSILSMSAALLHKTIAICLMLMAASSSVLILCFG